MNLNDASTLLNRYLVFTLNLTFPGLLILDTIFQKGLFSGGVKSLFDFLLLVVWALCISLPIQALTGLLVQPAKVLRSPVGRRMPGFVYDAIHLPFNILVSILVSFGVKVLVALDPMRLENAIVPALQAYFLAAMVIALALAFPLAYPYMWFLRISLFRGAIQELSGAESEPGV